MKTLDRRQALAGLVMATVTAATAAAQHRPQHASRHPQQQPRSQAPGKPDQAQGEAMMKDRSRMRDDDMYGSKLMTAEERDRYRAEMSGAKDDAELARIRAEHEREMMARAKAQGADLEPPVYGQHMMTAEERARYVKRLQDAASEGEREAIRNEHRTFIQERARELGVEVPPVNRN